jgi:hypothetical protein
MIFEPEKYFNDVDVNEEIITYKGEISSQTINEILDKVETKLKNINERSKIRKKVYNVLVESLQNLFHHLDDAPPNLGIPEKYSKYGVIRVLKTEEGYTISTANFVKEPKNKTLKNKIDKINSLSAEELKDLYKFILNHQKLSEKGGGGLGLIDIARKTGSKLEYCFEVIDEVYYLFLFTIKIK